MTLPEHPRISVVISTRNRPDALCRCLLALLEGDHTPAEVVVVDQGAPSVSSDVKTAFEDRDVPLRHVVTSDVGVSVGRNTGIGSSSGELIAFTDDDCVPHVRWLGALTRACRPGMDGVTGRVLPLASDRPDVVATSSRTSEVGRHFQGARRHLPWEVGTGGNMMFRRGVVEQVGGFDPTLGPGAAGKAAEDIDFLYRVLDAGFSIVYEPEAIVYHEMKPKRGRFRSRVQYGYGMGAFAIGHARKRDLYVFRVLWSYLRLRLIDLLFALRHARRRQIVESTVTIGSVFWGLGRHWFLTRNTRADR